MVYRLGNFESLGLQLLQFTDATTTDDLASAARQYLDAANRPIGVKFIVDVTNAELDIRSAQAGDIGRKG